MASGAGDAFERFYRCEYGRVVRLLVGMTGRWGLAEELAQEAFLGASDLSGVARARLARAITWTGSTTSSAWSSRVSLASRIVDDLVALCFGLG
jgi:DNA-directed RNA polymerase specialized sigma24 family protein